MNDYEYTTKYIYLYSVGDGCKLVFGQKNAHKAKKDKELQMEKEKLQFLFNLNQNDFRFSQFR